MSNNKLLMVEDDPGVQGQLRWSFDRYEVILAGDPESAINELKAHVPPVVTLDLGLPPDPANASAGLELLQKILKLYPHTKVIVVTGNEHHENALKSIELGAYDFYQKPIDTKELMHIVDRAFHLYRLEEENRELQRNDVSPLDGIIAASEEMLSVCQQVKKIAPTDTSVLILGESGTGKELVAQAIHQLSKVSKGPFVPVNCAAIPENLLESELFGYEKGAFTGAAKQTRGTIEYADGGTLFLDEIGDLPMGLQSKLLRFLQERVIERVGGRKQIPVDVRVVCATHQNLQQFIDEGKFREDLYYRINQINLNIPSLRERPGDAVLLAKAFLTRSAKKHGRNLHGLTKEAISAIESYSWPGNIRQLENKINRAVILTEDNFITPEDLELENTEQQEFKTLNLQNLRADIESRAIIQAIKMTDGNIAHASKLLGITRPTFYSLCEKYSIDH